MIKNETFRVLNANFKPLQIGKEEKITLTDGRAITVKKLSARPAIFEADNFLTYQECDHLMDLAKKNGLQESRTLDDDEELDTERLLDMDKFEDWDKDRNGNIEIKEVLREASFHDHILCMLL